MSSKSIKFGISNLNTKICVPKGVVFCVFSVFKVSASAIPDWLLSPRQNSGAPIHQL